MWRRSPVAAGSFYPSNPEKLKKDINTYLKNAEKKKFNGELFGLIVPHAGYIYSGPVAAYSYAQLINSDVELVIVLAPSHRARFDGASIVTDGVFEGPLGDVIIDEALSKSLEKQPHFEFIKEAHLYEHSLEVQIPFLQSVLKKFSLVPIVIGSVDIALCKALAEEITDSLVKEKRKFIIIISTDLSHYYSYESAKKMDSIFIDNLKSFDIQKLYQSLQKEESQACGEGPVLTGMFLAQIMGVKRIEILKYANSGDTAGDKEQVVGYLSAAIVK